MQKKKLGTSIPPPPPRIYDTDIINKIFDIIAKTII